MLSELNSLDGRLLHAINVGLSADWLNPVMVLLSSWLLWWGVAGLFLLIALYRRKPWEIRLALAILLAVGVADATSAYALKPYFARIRPCYAFQDLHQPAGCGSRFSFPSNHAANGMATTAVLMVAGTGPWAWASLALTLLVGLSRSYLGHHYPGDVLAGFFWGGCVGASVGWFFLRSKLFARYNRAKTLYG